MTPEARRRHRHGSQPNILVLDSIDEAARRDLSLLGNVTVQLRPSQPELLRLVARTNVIVLRSGVRLTATTIEAAPHLELIARAGVGVDNIDLESARQAGIVVFNVPTASADSVAEHAIGLMLTITRRILEATERVRRNEWQKEALIGMQLRGRRLGLVGHGTIGSKIGRLATAFGMRLLVTVGSSSDERRQRLRREGIHLVDLEQLLATSDVVCLAAPLNETTRSMIDSSALARMKPTANLVNIARAELVDEHALHVALSQRKIAGAALDTVNQTASGSSLADLTNCVVTPHIGAMTDDAQRCIGECLVAGIRAALSGEHVENRIH